MSLLAAGSQCVDAEDSEISRPSGRPNILVMVTDDQRGGMKVMPALRRRFAQEGTRFTRGYVTTPLCCPSRVSIMTGLYTHNHGVEVVDWTDLDQKSTLQRHLQENGYSTAIYGKYLNGWPIANDPPYFDDWAILEKTPQHSSVAYQGGVWNDNGRLRRVNSYVTHFLTNKALEFVRSSPEPWFLYLSPPSPHKPYVAEEAYAASRVPSWNGNPATRRLDNKDKHPYTRAFHDFLAERDQPTGPSGGRRIRVEQLRSLMSVDDMIEKFFETLNQQGQDRRTLAFFISDNGHMWGEHDLIGKGHPYIQSVRVPFFMRWPGRVQQGHRVDRLVANIDIAPTILSAAGIRSESPMDGKSLLDASSPRRRLLFEYRASAGWPVPRWAALITPDAHYIQFATDGQVSFEELYDLKEDPWEIRNVLEDGDPFNDAPAGQLRALLRHDRKCSGETCP